MEIAGMMLINQKPVECGFNRILSGLVFGPSTLPDFENLKGDSTERRIQFSTILARPLCQANSLYHILLHP
jgi:hypothetical protein